MHIPAFGPWSERDHMSDKQQRSIGYAQKAEITPISIDTEEQTGVFFGSGKEPYQTTLSSCTCSGFKGLPCKHIYRLAMELGIIDLPYKTGTPKGERLNMQIQLDTAIELIEGMSDAGQREIKEMVFRENDKRHLPRVVKDQDIVKDFRACPLLEELEPTDENLKKCANYRDAGANRDGCAIFSCIENFDIAQSGANTYLRRKFDDDGYFDERGSFLVPHGAKTPDLSIEISLKGVKSKQTKDPGAFYFPDDAITALLNKHGCNRCLGGYKPKIE